MGMMVLVSGIVTNVQGDPMAMVFAQSVKPINSATVATWNAIGLRLKM